MNRKVICLLVEVTVDVDNMEEHEIIGPEGIDPTATPAQVIRDEIESDLDSCPWVVSSTVSIIEKKGA